MSGVRESFRFFSSRTDLFGLLDLNKEIPGTLMQGVRRAFGV
jgi:hypothetical protein